MPKQTERSTLNKNSKAFSAAFMWFRNVANALYEHGMYTGA
jgi:hypothetical protein